MNKLEYSFYGRSLRILLAMVAVLICSEASIFAQDHTVRLPARREVIVGRMNELTVKLLDGVLKQQKLLAAAEARYKWQEEPLLKVLVRIMLLKKPNAYGSVFDEAHRVLGGLQFPYPVEGETVRTSKPVENFDDYIKLLDQIHSRLSRWDYRYIEDYNLLRDQDPEVTSWFRFKADRKKMKALYDYWFQSEKLRDYREMLSELLRVKSDFIGNSLADACSTALAVVYRGRVTRLKNDAELAVERWQAEENARRMSGYDDEGYPGNE